MFPLDEEEAAETQPFFPLMETWTLGPWWLHMVTLSVSSLNPSIKEASAYCGFAYDTHNNG